MRLVTNALRRLIRSAGFDLVRRGAIPSDFDDRDAAIIREVMPYTMTSAERLHALIRAVRYVCAAGVRGSIVECGVWRGGSMMAAVRALQDAGEPGRDLYLYDTYEGMSAPTDLDVDPDGQKASALMRAQDVRAADSVWCYAPLEEVRANLLGTGYHPDRLHFVRGKVEETIPGTIPERIAVLRLDTDWYESTRHELTHLFPRLAVGGVLIIDDYGHWAGCRRAVDEFLASHAIHLLLYRVDYSGRIAIKPA